MIGAYFFFNDTATTEIYTLSLHDALPICRPVPEPVSAVDRVRSFLHAHPTEAVDLDELPDAAKVSRSAIRSFSRLVGLPLRSYHTQLRLARARRLLTQGRSATWVAYECGFADQAHLSRRFKECHGVAPGVFQAQWRSTGDTGRPAGVG